FVTDPGSLWVVASGYVDLFLVEGVDGERVPFMHVPQGQIFFGIAPQGKASLLAVGNAETKLLRIPVTRFHELTADAEQGRDAVAALDAWILALSSAMRQAAVPTQALRLTPANDAALDDNTTATAAQGVLWTRATSGALHLAGRDDLRIGAACPV